MFLTVKSVRNFNKTDKFFLNVWVILLNQCEHFDLLVYWHGDGTNNSTGCYLTKLEDSPYFTVYPIVLS